jgi:calcineurin-like phosphoesterase family protein
MAEVYIISDNHFGHSGVLNFRKQNGDRPRAFDSVEEMDEHMIERWNSVVRP